MNWGRCGLSVGSPPMNCTVGMPSSAISAMAWCQSSRVMAPAGVSGLDSVQQCVHLMLHLPVISNSTERMVRKAVAVLNEFPSSVGWYPRRCRGKSVQCQGRYGSRRSPQGQYVDRVALSAGWSSSMWRRSSTLQSVTAAMSRLRRAVVRCSSSSRQRVQWGRGSGSVGHVGGGV